MFPDHVLFIPFFFIKEDVAVIISWNVDTEITEYFVQVKNRTLAFLRSQKFC